MSEQSELTLDKKQTDTNKNEKDVYMNNLYVIKSFALTFLASHSTVPLQHTKALSVVPKCNSLKRHLRD